MIKWQHNIGKIVLILLVLALMALLIIALIGCHVTGRSFDECFFGTCCGSLYVLGLALGFTYKEICVIKEISKIGQKKEHIYFFQMLMASVKF